MNALTETVREFHDLKAQLAKHEGEAQSRSEQLRGEIRKRAKIMEMATEGLDADKIALAETVLQIHGSYAKGGTDRASVVSDAIKQIATGEPIRAIYNDLWRTYFGTKNYAHWSGQRSDHEYGYGPKHGSVVFSIGFRGEIRKREPRELTADETEAAIYYLTNLQRVQDAKARAVLAT